MTEQQYKKLLPYKTNWQQLNSAGEMHCNINCWKAVIEVGQQLDLPWNKATHLKLNQSCPACKSEAITAVMQKFDAYELQMNNPKEKHKKK